ncbi:MAG TPA: DNA translocase FtsK 4TM domain-containing protein, partial [Acidimicrobiales bacterium]|nr:DNA translocase FtsK 4TM domain-containing protein [Acidimicrobiales bacterium]
MATRPATKKAAPAKKAAAKRPAPPPKAKEKPPRLGGHGYDVGGLVLVLLALVTALATYGDLAGPAGRALGDGAGVVLGYGRWALPFLLAGAGAMLLWRETPGDPGRLAIGLSMATVAGCGLIHLLTDGPGWGAPAADLRASGGIVGTVAAVPLRTVLAGPGAAAVLFTVLGVAMLVLARTTVRTAASQAAGAARTAGARLADLGRALFELRPPPLPAVPEAEVEVPLPQLTAPQPEPDTPPPVEIR